MLKKIFILCLLLGHTLSVQALDKTRVNLDKEFWGTWVLHNPKTQCIEKFEFKKPGDFKYQVNKKLLVGEFAVVRSTSSDNLDVHFE